MISKRFFRPLQKFGAVLWIRPNSSHEFTNNGHPDTLSTENQAYQLVNRLKSHSPPKKQLTIPNDYVVALTGYLPNFELLTKSGITLSNDEKRLPNYNPETMETNVEGLYLAGVICGGKETHKWFIENSRIHAKIISKHIEKKLKWT